jgi:hypothetical protein
LDDSCLLACSSHSAARHAPTGLRTKEMQTATRATATHVAVATGHESNSEEWVESSSEGSQDSCDDDSRSLFPYSFLLSSPLPPPFFLRPPPPSDLPPPSFIHLLCYSPLLHLSSLVCVYYDCSDVSSDSSPNGPARGTVEDEEWEEGEVKGSIGLKPRPPDTHISFRKGT